MLNVWKAAHKTLSLVVKMEKLNVPFSSLRSDTISPYH